MSYQTNERKFVNTFEGRQDFLEDLPKVGTQSEMWNSWSDVLSRFLSSGLQMAAAERTAPSQGDSFC